MKDIMLDLETLGLDPGHKVLSIGAVEFSRVTGEIGEQFYAVLDTKSQGLKGLKTDDATLDWWKEQNQEAWRRATDAAQPAEQVLKEFRLWYKFRGCTALWANGANFDPPMLQAVYKAFDQKLPWHYRHPRDCRTVFDLVGKQIGAYGTDNPLAHDALQDAIWQAKETAQAIIELLE